MEEKVSMTSSPGVVAGPDTVQGGVVVGGVRVAPDGVVTVPSPF